MEIEFEKNANARIAAEQKAYLRNQFEFYGLKTPERRKIQKPFLIKRHLPPKNDLNELVQKLWKKPQREFLYFSQELALTYNKAFEKNDIALFEYMATHKSWWDTVDFISIKLMGAYFKLYPEQRRPYVEKWVRTGNIWLQRCTLLFQLKYKKNLDTALLGTTVEALSRTGEFFIDKAIGWILREYSRTDPKWVLEVADHMALSNLSKREALRLIE